MIVMLGITLICGCDERNKKTETDNTKTLETALALEYPEEYLIYQDYLDVIEGVSRHFHKNIGDTGTIEATVISLRRDNICPYNEEKCRIEPYPLDVVRVRIDKIIEYTKYSEQTVENPIEAMEKPTNEKEQSEEDQGEQVPGYEGKFVPKPKLLEYDPLQEGQEVQAKFLLSARPVKVIYTSIPPKEEPEPSQLELGEEQAIIVSEDHTTTAKEPSASNDSTITVSSGTINIEEHLPKVYKPIPKEGDYFVFTTRIIEYPEISQKVLPGLKEGDKFRAKITYAGTLYLEEYELI